MKNVQDKYTVFDLVLTPKSPVFIGSGETLNKAMYYFDEKNKLVKVVDEKKLINYLSKSKFMDRFDKLVFQGKNLADFFPAVNIKPNNIDIWKYNVNTLVDREKSLNEISTFIKGPNGLPYIPGSSVKGALKTALLNYEIYENKHEYIGFFNEINTFKENNLAEKLEDIENKVWNKYVLKYGSSYKDNENYIFNALRISDSSEFKAEHLKVMQRIDSPIYKDKPSPMPIFLEMICSFDKVHFELTIDEDLNKSKLFTKENIEKALKTFTDIQKGSMSVFENVNSKYSDFMGRNADINFCLGGNAGFWSKTLIYALAPDKCSAINVLRKYFSNSFSGHKHDEHDIHTAPYTLTFVGKSKTYLPVGWCNLSLRKK